MDRSRYTTFDVVYNRAEGYNRVIDNPIIIRAYIFNYS